MVRILALVVLRSSHQPMHCVLQGNALYHCRLVLRLSASSLHGKEDQVTAYDYDWPPYDPNVSDELKFLKRIGLATSLGYTPLCPSHCKVKVQLYGKPCAVV